MTFSHDLMAHPQRVVSNGDIVNLIKIVSGTYTTHRRLLKTVDNSISVGGI